MSKREREICVRRSISSLHDPEPTREVHSIVSTARKNEAPHMTTIRQLLREKGPKVHSISPDATVYDAIRKMADENVGSLVAMEGEKIVGIITERHYARNIADLAIGAFVLLAVVTHVVQ
jgi:signal-transduction protein with cAMP-binding, CBS, and nucleotidyltransferase domain